MIGTTTASSSGDALTGDRSAVPAEHTPGPWIVEESRVQDTGTLFETIRSSSCLDTGDIAYLTLRQSEVRANADFIVRACNAHDDLVAALEAMCLNMKQDRHEYRDCYKAARAAIAKAIGGEK